MTEGGAAPLLATSDTGLAEAVAPGQGVGSRWWAGWRRPSSSVPLGIAVVFFVVGAGQIFTAWHPVGDYAVSELILRHTGRAIPLSGAYSAQRNYNHPLPWAAAMQWLPYWLSGQRSTAVLAASVWWNGACLAGLAWLLARRRALGLLLAALVALTGMVILGDHTVLLLPWNPNLALVAGLAFMFVTWRVAVGERWLLPVSAGLGLWCGGAHLGLVPLVAGVGAVAGCSLVV
ncbi:MAG TPA: hypothetical protein VGM93_07865, partial [Acidimicrobiales bacterium]